MDTRHDSNVLPELWGGVECTINRIQDTYNDQLARNGHSARLEDIDLFAQLGMRALRYPILWERFAPDKEHSEIEWDWAHARLQRLRELGVNPIVGLVHHGSGPRHTSLVDPSFAGGLARYASAVARRFPWVRDWTPVNEPLTTARFSGLYGHWYPHGTDESTFARALINQCHAIALSMQAIRKVNPVARLIQTEDLGRTYSTPQMQHQAEFENERRWLSWDLLCGRVDPHHRMWGHLQWAGISEAELRWFVDNPCPPDIIGINYYLTSERFLDERLEHYPARCYGSNGRERYADVEAVRVRCCEIQGPRGILEEAWQRYRRPLAITEVHLGCTREEQMRWLLEVWESACALRGAGIDIRAVTAWALLGSYDWNSMLTEFAGHYEPGVFDVRGETPRPTALVPLLQAMAQGKQPDHPVLATVGWWHRPKRILYRAEAELPATGAPSCQETVHFRRKPPQPLLITGGDSTLGLSFARLCDHRNLVHVALSQEQMDITDPAAVEAVLKRYRPWAVINAVEYVPVTGLETEAERCSHENTKGPTLLAMACAREKLGLLTFSSDQVFNGHKAHPYVESDACTPTTLYGQSKAIAEANVLQILPDALVVRHGALFGPWDERHFVAQTLRLLCNEQNLNEQNLNDQNLPVVQSEVLSPTYIPDLVHACLDLMIDGDSGIWHLANEGAVTWEQLAKLTATCAGFDPKSVRVKTLVARDPSMSRICYRVLGSERAQLLQPLEMALKCYLQDSDTVVGTDATNFSAFSRSGFAWNAIAHL